MSRGLGSIQRRVLETLRVYVGCQWEWRRTLPHHSLGNYAEQRDIDAYERGERVPCWMLRRDLECSADTLSRALRSLQRRGMVALCGGDLSVGLGGNWTQAAKFVTLTRDGSQAADKFWGKRKVVKVDTYDGRDSRSGSLAADEFCAKRQVCKVDTYEAAEMFTPTAQEINLPARISEGQAVCGSVAPGDSIGPTPECVA